MTAPHGSSTRRNGLWGIIAVGAFFVLTKFKTLVSVLKLGPLLTTLSTMGLSILAYMSFYGLELAAGLVLLILVHEHGHGVAARVMGLRVGAPIFIPFFGALIAIKDQVKSTWIQCVVGFGGPLAGTLGAACTLVIGHFAPVEDPGFWMVLTWLTAMINLFNLMPVLGLDGDHISEAFRAWFWTLILPVIGAIMYTMHRLNDHIHPVLFFIFALGIVKAWRQSTRERGTSRPRRLIDQLNRQQQEEIRTEESSVRPVHRVFAAMIYTGLLLALSALILATHSRLP